MRKRNPIIALLAAGSLILAACGDDEADAPETTEASADEAGDIIEVATAAGSFNTLAAALTAAGLVETLQGEGPFTVFAPTDEAFAALPEGFSPGVYRPPRLSC